ITNTIDTQLNTLSLHDALPISLRRDELDGSAERDDAGPLRCLGERGDGRVRRGMEWHDLGLWHDLALRRDELDGPAERYAVGPAGCLGEGGAGRGGRGGGRRELERHVGGLGERG